VVNGRIEEYGPEMGAVVLPCYEYFDAGCVGDPRSALGAYVNYVFKKRASEFASLIEREARGRLGAGIE
jgi:hypothetical protein